MVVVSAFQYDANRKSLIKPHPVERLFDIWETANSRDILLRHSPSNTLHLTLEMFPGVAQQRHIGSHSWTDPIEDVFAEIRKDIPVAIIYQHQDRLPGISELPLRYIQIGDVAVERRAHQAVVVVQLRVLERLPVPPVSAD